MARIKVVLNPAGMRALLRGDGMRRDMLARAERVVEAARADAEGFKKTGNYQASIKAYDDVTDEGAVGRAGASVPYAFFVEAEHGTLARALDAAG